MKNRCDDTHDQRHRLYLIIPHFGAKRSQYIP